MEPIQYVCIWINNSILLACISDLQFMLPISANLSMVGQTPAPIEANFKGTWTAVFKPSSSALWRISVSTSVVLGSFSAFCRNEIVSKIGVIWSTWQVTLRKHYITRKESSMIPKARPQHTRQWKICLEKFCFAGFWKVGTDGRTPIVNIVIISGRVRVGVVDQFS